MEECRLLDAALRMVVYERLAGSPRAAPSGAGLWQWLRLARGLESAGHLLRLLRILLAGAPEDDAARHAPDRDGDVQITSHAENIVFHALRPDLRAPMDAGGLARDLEGFLSRFRVDQIIIILYIFIYNILIFIYN
jgi:hypothetical protein